MPRKLLYSEAPGDRRKLILLLGSTLLWALCLAGASSLLERNLPAIGILPALAAISPMAVGVLVIWSHIHYLQHADELQRRIQLYAMAVGFGVTIIFALSYPVLEHIGAPHDGNKFVLVGAFAYAAGALYWSRRYR